MTARRRGMTEEAADAAIDQACRMLRMPTIRNSFADQADRAASEQMSYRRRQLAPASPQQAGPVQAVPAAALGAGLPQRRPALPRGRRAGLCRQLRPGPQLPGRLPGQARPRRAAPTHGAAGRRLAHPPPRHPDRGRPGAAQGGLGAVPGTALGRRPRPRLICAESSGQWLVRMVRAPDHLPRCWAWEVVRASAHPYLGARTRERADPATRCWIGDRACAATQSLEAAGGKTVAAGAGRAWAAAHLGCGGHASAGVAVRRPPAWAGQVRDRGEGGVAQPIRCDGPGG
jgi:hypothetical protein